MRQLSDSAAHLRLSRRSCLAAMAGVAALAAAPSAAAAPRPPRAVRETAVGERLVDLSFDSPALGGRGRVRLLTPAGWAERRAGDRWPVLWLLPGGDGDHLTWTVDFGVQDLPELRDVLVVMPDMPLYGFYTDWWNHDAGGPPRVESYHLREVLPLVEERYGGGGRRVAAGLSQGGFGALSYTARHPGLFRAAASYSGFVHPSRHPHAVRAGMTYLGLDWLALWGDPELQAEVWDAHDPGRHVGRLAAVPLYLSCGDGRLGPLDLPGTEPDEEIPGLEDPEDPFPEDVYSPTEAVMLAENEVLADRLRAAGAELTTHFHSGTHSPPYWGRELRASLPMLLDALHGTDGAVTRLPA
ncbi:alpha/beta hydrolase [Streptomyces sp. NPDC127098]|uniref:alpha/beta hydrolase n=1 Tax=Streptomyces sp. NPDC127098 TaxID=3347137 RepID=UPI00365E928E